MYIFSNVSLKKVSGKEYCIFESFKPTCLDSEIIWIEKAIFGRMNFGKCVNKNEFDGDFKQNTRTFGCQVDAMNIINKICAFKTNCEINVVDEKFEKINPCLSVLKSYLDVEYRCVNVLKNDLSTCKVSLFSKVLHINPNVNNGESQCGIIMKPWIIGTGRGQKIKISMMKTAQNVIEDQLELCQISGFVMEKSKQIIRICSNGFFEITNTTMKIKNNLKAKTDIFLSTNNEVQLILNHASEKDNVSNFLLKLEDDGCSDLFPPEDAWLKRNYDDITIGCYTNKQTWYLRCENRKWSGVLGNCSTNDQNILVNEQNKIEMMFWKPIYSKEHQILTIVAIAGVCFIICLIVICAGVVIIKRKYTVNQKQMNPYYMSKQYEIYQNSQGRYSNKNSNADIQIIDDRVKNSLDESEYFVLESEDLRGK